VPEPFPSRRDDGRLELRAVPDPLAASPGRVCVFVVGVTLVGLALDRMVSVPGQYVLGLMCWLMLALALRSATRIERVQTLVVIAVATVFEVIGSIIWGAYIYRHHNLPMFVPPGHGMVYLFGLRLSQTAWVRAHTRLWIHIAAVALVAWGVVGLAVLPRTDLGGALGVVVLLAFLLRGRNASVYASVFAFVAFLEIYGVSMGTWAWQAHVPGTPVPTGNPPSGIAAGYVFFDIAAIAISPWILARWERWRGSPIDAHAPVVSSSEHPGVAVAPAVETSA
jgi:hypothetical protein